MADQQDNPADVPAPAPADQPADVPTPAPADKPAVPALSADEITALIAKNKAYKEAAAARIVADKKAEQERLKKANEFEKLFETEKERADRLEQENAPLRKIHDELKAGILQKLEATDDPILQSLSLEQLRVIESKLPVAGQPPKSPGGVGHQGNPGNTNPYDEISTYQKTGNTQKAYELQQKYGVRL